jgi:bisphosphoglycerate-independent phosphoglycerate mutase (AlkP superfamily)
VKAEYAAKKTDEFMPPFVCVKEPRPLIAEGDGILFSTSAATARGN